MQTQVMIQKAAHYKGGTSMSRARYIVNHFKNDNIPMLIFSYMWSNQQATKSIREINSKCNEIIGTNFEDDYMVLFTQIEYSKPGPLKDVHFDDFADFNFIQYKDVHVHEMAIYDNGEFINGLEMYYLVDGDVTKYALHHRIIKGAVTSSGMVEKKALANPLQALFGSKGDKKSQKVIEVEMPDFKKTSVYLKRSEFITRIKLSGQKYLHYMEIEVNTGRIYRCGHRKGDDHDCEFEVEDGFKIIAFAGVMEVMMNECRILNLSITSKEIYSDCESSAAISPTYRDIIQMRYEMFNAFKTDVWGQIKRIKTIKLYPGKVIGKEKELSTKYDVLGGIQITYELRNGEEFENGISSLRCTYYEQEPVVLELKDNEYITSITGFGANCIQGIAMETNFYRKVKQGLKKVEGKMTGGGGAPEMTQKGALGSLAGVGNIGAPGTHKNTVVNEGSATSFSIQLPAGAKVVAIAGTADDYIRSIFAYYRI